jgi:hypothetical protein
VRFEQFPSESLSGATVYKTQQADLAEGGIATTIDLQTVSPLKMSGRQVVLRADALYYPLGKDIQGADKSAPRVGGVFSTSSRTRPSARHWPSAIRINLQSRRTSVTGASTKPTRST